MQNGNFVISLDFELMWGVRDKKTIASYGNSIKAVHQVIPNLLNLFKQYNINATFSTVGFLFCNAKTDLLKAIPNLKPSYQNSNLSPYNGHINTIGNNYLDDPYHYGDNLIAVIKNFTNHEIGSHTFSHYYCLEKGQNVAQFEADLVAAIDIAKKGDVEIKSLIFPRNQFNEEYLEVCAKHGILCYRGNEKSWIYDARNGNDESKFRRAFRLLDAYINLTGNNCYSDDFIKNNFPINIPSSRFLRPYALKLKWLDYLRLKRIKNGMTYAAKKKLTYHLWWHPHNFGVHSKENFEFLEKILAHFCVLEKQFNFKSITMTNLAKKAMSKNEF